MADNHAGLDSLAADFAFKAMDGGNANASVEREAIVEASEEFGQRALVASRAQLGQRHEGRIRDRDQGITRNIDHFMEELRREQEAIDKRSAEYEKRRNELRSQLQNNHTGNGAMSLDYREGPGDNDEDDWEEEYVVLDLDDVFHGAPIPNFAYTLSGLDTLNPILTLDNGLKLIGQYMETVGSVVVYSEREKDVFGAQADTRELPTPADPYAVHTVKKPLKRIRGVCKLERKLKFCAMPIDTAPPNNGMFMQSTYVQNAMPAGDVSLMNAMPVEDVSHVNDIPMENPPLHKTAPTEDASPEKSMLSEDAPTVNARAIKDAALENATATVDASLDKARETEDTALKTVTVMEDASVGNATATEGASVENARATEGLSLENTTTTEDASRDNATSSEGATLKNATDASLEKATAKASAPLENATATEGASSEISTAAAGESLEITRSTQDSSLENAKPMEVSLENATPTDDDPYSI